MAVYLEPISLIQPRGELSYDFFPGCDLNSLATGWIQQAIDQVEATPDITEPNKLSAVKAWTYYLAYMYLADTVGTTPSSVSVNNGADTVAFGQDRLTYWLARAAEKRGAYLELVDAVPVLASTQSKPKAIQTIGIW